MKTQLASSAGSQECFRPGRDLAVDGTISPLRNRLLQLCSEEDYARLLPNLEPVRLARGTIIYRAGEQQTHLYFITSGIVICLYEATEGDSTGFAVTGREGAVGGMSFLSRSPLLNKKLVVESGHAYRLTVEAVNKELMRGSSLAVALLRHVEATMTQMVMDIACTRHHAVEQQLCRWFLDCLDRTPRHEFAMTQELLSNILGVRRESVTAAAVHLKAAGVIDYYRGRLVLRDRAGLEARVCGCYEVARQALSMGQTMIKPVMLPGRA